MRSVLGAAIGLLVSAFLSANAWAQIESISLNGEYNFDSAAKKGNRPVCSERWLFKDDGTFAIYSGEEVITGNFHIERTAESSIALVEDTRASNGGADCLGRVENPIASGPLRTPMYLSATGDLVVLRERVSSDGLHFAQIVGVLRRVSAAPLAKSDMETPH